MFEPIHNIRKLYANRTFSFLEEQLEHIIVMTFTACQDSVKDINMVCPNEHLECSTEPTKCSLPDKEINQQRFTKAPIYFRRHICLKEKSGNRCDDESGQ